MLNTVRVLTEKNEFKSRIVRDVFSEPLTSKGRVLVLFENGKGRNFVNEFHYRWW